MGFARAPTAVKFDSATLNGSAGAFVAMLTLTTADDAKRLKIRSKATKDIQISFDGTVIHDYILAGEGEWYDIAANGLSLGSVVYGRTDDAAAGTGNVILAALL